MPDKIILPKIQINETDYDKISNTRMLKAIALLNECKNEKFIISKCKNALEKYANGAMEVATGCFAGIKKLTLVVPADYSIMLGWNCFDNNAEINLELPKDMTLKQIFRIFDTSFDYERENWTLISHKNFNYKNKNYCGIHTTEFKPEYASRYKFTISGKKLEFDENKNL